MPLDFPSGPAINDTWTGSNGVTYTWTGTMWTVSGSGTGPYLPLAGGTMTGGDITLFRDPTQPLHASPRRYVDNAINLAGNYLGTWSVAANSPNISAGGAISNANYVATTVNPATPEVVPVGVPGIAGLTVANGDRVIWASGLGTWQLLRNAGVTLAAADARYVALGGSVMTGALTLPGNAASALQAVPLQQVPVASSTVPAMDGTATIGAGTTWAKADHIHPTDTSRASLAAVNAAAAAAANNVGRNLIHNSRFNVAQRGAGGFSTTGYTLDRWGSYFVNGSQVINQIANPDASSAAIGDEASAFIVQANITGSATAGSVNEIYQCIEDVRRLAGKTVTLSLWAWMGSGSAKIGANVYQSFGSGGSPSASVFVPGQSITITATPARYSFTFTLPSTAGKTIGTNGNSFTGLNLYFSGATDQNTNTGSVGVQTGFFYLWGVQLEIGSVATPLEKPDPQVELANCQRFYQTGHFSIMGSSGAGGQFGSTLGLPVAMRAAPTVALVAPSYTNASGGASGNAGSTSAILSYANATAAGSTAYFSGDFTASADL